MTLKTFIPACALLAMVGIASFQASRRVEKLEGPYLRAGNADFSIQALEHPSAATLGQMLRIASGGAMKQSELRIIAERIKRRRNGGEEWVAQFMTGYHCEPMHNGNAR